MYGSRKGYLPAFLAAQNDANDWVLGPRIHVHNHNSSGSSNYLKEVYFCAPFA